MVGIKDREMTKANIKKDSGDLGNLLFVVTEDWYFCSHRLQLAVAAQRVGYNVAVVTQETSHGEVIRQAGLRLIPVKFRRSGRNPFSDFMTIRSLISIYRSEQPDIIHHVSLKPVLYGSIAARFAGNPGIINAMTGLGHALSSEDFFAKFIRFLISPFLAYIFSAEKTITIFQNGDDLKTLEDRNLVKHGQTVIIRGSGVDLDTYIRGRNKTTIPQVVLVARMLWTKGVEEFVQAAKLLLTRGSMASFILIGDTDSENPAAISVEQLGLWQAEKNVEWWGRRSDIPEILQQSAIACLPSWWGEGVPKFLLEAASASLPIVTTDVPGCREAVINGENGYLVPSRNYVVLADAIEKLINDKALRKEMGRNGRALTEREFGIEKIIEETISLYQRILN